MAGNGQLPKEKLVETAAELIYRQGWNATGINQILTEAQVPKGSFYYYFHSKDDLGVAIVKFHAQKLRETYSRTLQNERLTGRKALEDYCEWVVALQRQNDWRLGCPVGSFSNEVAATTEKISAACRDAMTEMVAALGQAIERGQKDGSVVAVEEPKMLSVLIVSIMQGGMLIMKTHHEEEPLRIALGCLRHKLFGE